MSKSVFFFDIKLVFMQFNSHNFFNIGTVVLLARTGTKIFRKQYKIKKKLKGPLAHFASTQMDALLFLVQSDMIARSASVVLLGN